MDLILKTGTQNTLLYPLFQTHLNFGVFLFFHNAQKRLEGAYGSQKSCFFGQAPEAVHRNLRILLTR